MISKVVHKTKTFRGSKGFIGKSVPCTFTFFGLFYLKTVYSSSNRIAHSKPLSTKENEKEVVACV
jgi:hypothetical protein